jgi:hypothetical protein
LIFCILGLDTGRGGGGSSSRHCSLLKMFFVFCDRVHDDGAKFSGRRVWGRSTRDARRH